MTHSKSRHVDENVSKQVLLTSALDRQEQASKHATEGRTTMRAKCALNTYSSHCVTVPSSSTISIHNENDDNVIVSFILFFALLARPPISPATGGPTVPKAHKVVTSRRSSDRNRASDRAVGGRTPRCRGLTQRRGFGVLHGIWREPPENWESGGAKRAGKKETQLTISAFNFPQFTQIHSKIFFTFTKKPSNTCSGTCRSKKIDMTHLGEIQDGPARCVRSGLDTQPCLHHTSGT